MNMPMSATDHQNQLKPTVDADQQQLVIEDEQQWQDGGAHFIGERLNACSGRIGPTDCRCRE